MKKITALLVSISILSLFSGCGGQPEQQAVKDNNTINTEQSAINNQTAETTTEEVVINNDDEVEKYQTLLNNVNSTVKDCETIKDNQLYQNCADDALMKQALRESNADLCGQVKDEITKKLCISQFPTTSLPPKN